MIATNYSDLSPAQREILTAELQPWGDGSDAPSVLVFRTQGTLNALIAKGFVVRKGEDYQRYGMLTDAGQRARRFLLRTNTTPAKVIPWAERAEAAGLIAEEAKGSGSIRSWTIRAPEESKDSTQLWLYWSPGKRGGRLSITVYYGHPNKPRAEVPSRLARIALEGMADHERQRQHWAKMREATGRPALKMVTVTLDHWRANLPGSREYRVVFRDPTHPSWFQMGQVIMHRGSDVVYTIISLTHEAGLTVAAEVSVNGSRPTRWFGDHPYASDVLAALEGPHVGRPFNTMRPWPQSIRPAVEAVRLTLHDQRLTGWAAPAPDARGVVVNLPWGSDPERHLILLGRYLPYPSQIEIRSRRDSGYVTLLITPDPDVVLTPTVDGGTVQV